MLVINNIPDLRVPLYDSADKLVGDVNFLQFNDCRCQIKEQKLEGYYVMFNGKKILINKEGRCSAWPVGFFDTLDNQMDRLLD